SQRIKTLHSDCDVVLLCRLHHLRDVLIAHNGCNQADRAERRWALLTKIRIREAVRLMENRRDERFDGMQKPEHRDGFRNIRVTPAVESRISIPSSSKGGYGNDRNVAGSVVAFEVSGYFQPRYFVELKVHQNKIGSGLQRH